MKKTKQKVFKLNNKNVKENKKETRCFKDSFRKLSWTLEFEARSPTEATLKCANKARQNMHLLQRPFARPIQDLEKSSL